MIDKFFGKILNDNGFIIESSLLENSTLEIRANRNMQRIWFNLCDSYILVITAPSRGFEIPLSHFLSNLSQRGGEEEFARVLDGLIKSLPL
jgi:hypothetical protein